MFIMSRVFETLNLACMSLILFFLLALLFANKAHTVTSEAHTVTSSFALSLSYNHCGTIFVKSQKFT